MISNEGRPIFHWTEPGIKGHFVICFLAFLLERILESKLKRIHLSASLPQIREVLNSINFAEVKIKQKKFFIKTRFENLSNKILKLMCTKSLQMQSQLVSHLVGKIRKFTAKMYIFIFLFVDK